MAFTTVSAGTPSMNPIFNFCFFRLNKKKKKHGTNLYCGSKMKCKLKIYDTPLTFTFWRILNKQEENIKVENFKKKNLNCSKLYFSFYGLIYLKLNICKHFTWVCTHYVRSVCSMKNMFHDSVDNNTTPAMLREILLTTLSNTRRRCC